MTINNLHNIKANMGIGLNFLPRECPGFQLVCNKWSLGLYQAVTFNQVKTALEICFSVNEKKNPTDY